ncbi:MAG TPA: hypothetical protein VFW55_08925 [Propionicimonas sp.]|nr:hypothetical protein [Propionicimonas sp.]
MNDRPGPSGEQSTPHTRAPGQRPHPPQPAPPQPDRTYQYPPGYAGEAYRPPVQPDVPDREPPPEPKGKGALTLGIAGGVVILGLIAVVAFPGIVGSAVPTPFATTAGGMTGATAPPSATGAAAVKGYLKAVAGGHAASAIAYGATRPIEQSLLTDEMLAANRAAAPITDIKTTEGTGGDHQTVQATYKLGGTPVSTTFEVTRANGTWVLDAVAAPLPLDLSSTAGADLRINGRKLPTTTPAVFPGRYTITTSDGWFTVSGGKVQVENGAGSGTVRKAKLKLSASGVSAIRKAAQAKLNWCLRTDSLTPADCAADLVLPNGNTVRRSTIDWQVTRGGSAMRTLTPILDSARSAHAKVSVKTRVYCTSTDGHRWRGYATIRYVYATLAAHSVKIEFTS